MKEFDNHECTHNQAFQPKIAKFWLFCVEQTNLLIYMCPEQLCTNFEVAARTDMVLMCNNSTGSLFWQNLNYSSTVLMPQQARLCQLHCHLCPQALNSSRMMYRQSYHMILSEWPL